MCLCSLIISIPMIITHTHTREEVGLRERGRLNLMTLKTWTHPHWAIDEDIRQTSLVCVCDREKERVGLLIAIRYFHIQVIFEIL